jgi:PspAB-like protein
LPVGFLDTLLGRTKPAPPNLDNLFGLPGAAVTLEAATDFKPTGTGSVCFRATEGRAFSDIEKDVNELLRMDKEQSVEVSKDSYGFTWLVCRHAADDPAGLVTNLHAVNSSLEQGGFGPQLLCTIMAFRDSGGRSLGLVYLYKRGTFYPFAPAGGERRDNGLELQIRGVLGDDLKVEPDLSRWFPVWGAPGL